MFEIDSIVRIKAPDADEGKLGCVLSCGKKFATISLLEDQNVRRILFDKLELVPVIPVTSDVLKAYLRYELSPEELLPPGVPEEYLQLREKYFPTLDDMVCGLENIRSALGKKDGAERFGRWVRMLLVDLRSAMMLGDGKQREGWRPFVPQTEHDLMQMISYQFDLAFIYAMDKVGEPLTVKTVDLILNDIERFRRGERVYAWRWSDYHLRRLIDRLEDEDVDTADDVLLASFRQDTERLCAHKDPIAMEKIAWFGYGGNRAFPCDWKRTRDLFLQLMDDERVGDQKKCRFANALGYIYYYGRCTGGTPDYASAFRYFSFGVAGGYYESMYKLADMYLNGYGVPVNTLAARNYVTFVYDNNRKLFLKGEYECQFADAALRMGDLCMKELVEGDPLIFYMEADLAIRKRLPYNHFGDQKVLSGIQRGLAEARRQRPVASRTEYEMLPFWILRALEDHTCCLILSQTAQGTTIKAKLLPDPRKEAGDKIIVCEPDIDYCDVVDAVTYTIKGAQRVRLDSYHTRIIADEAQGYETPDGVKLEFLHHGEFAASLIAEGFRFKPPKKGKEPPKH